MRHFLFGSYLIVVASILASSGAVANGAPASRGDAPAPTYMNAEVIRVDAEVSTITLKSESGETVLQVEGEARTGLSGLRAKDKVIVTYHVIEAAAGDSRRVALQVRPASQSSGEPVGPAARGATLATRVVKPVAATPVTTTAPTLDCESAAQDFEVAAARLATQANAIDGLWLGFQEGCLTEPPARNRSRGWFQLLDGTIPEPDQDGCRQQYKDLISKGERVRESVRLAEEGARKAEVLPGHLRETLERHRLDF